ncbi:hypothetical protein NX059_006173 [Plenodomus lindquistii]|nr:hypothetical protein NX059_006173 [Plenodomus lindquistii]
MSASQEALGIAEILENVLQHLGLRDTLYNVQAVSKFWRNCIRGSATICKMTFLTPIVVGDECADEQLYKAYKFIFYRLPSRHYSDIASILALDEAPTLPNIRQKIFDTSQQSYESVAVGLVRMQVFLAEDQIIRPYHANFKSGIADMFALGLICTPTTHPQILRHFWCDQGCIWTGYGAHGVLYIHDIESKNYSCFVAHSNVFDHISELKALCSSANWLDSSLTKPALTIVSVFMPVTCKRPVWKTATGRCDRTTGVTIRDFIQLLTTVAIDFREGSDLSKTLTVSE